MPVISMFHGILIRMYFYDTDNHHTPHIHAAFGDSAAVRHPRRRTPDWRIAACQGPARGSVVELHRDELLADWQLATAGQALFRIEPLR